MQLRVENLLLARHYVALGAAPSPRTRSRGALSSARSARRSCPVRGRAGWPSLSYRGPLPSSGISSRAGGPSLWTCPSVRRCISCSRASPPSRSRSDNLPTQWPQLLHLSRSISSMPSTSFAAPMGARGLDGAFLAAVAAVLVELWHELAYYADVVEVGLDAVVRASADRYLELVRQAHLTVALVEAARVSPARTAKLSMRPYWQGRPLARDDGAHLRAGAARFEAGLRDGRRGSPLSCRNGTPLALDRLARRERH